MNTKNTRINFLKQTGKVISHKRKRKNISQQELGQVLNVSKSTISRYEKGEIDMPVSNLPIISNYCDFKLRDYLIEWESSNIEDFVKRSLSYKNFVPEKQVVKEYINSCSESELFDLSEIDYCINNLKNDDYKQEISDIIIEKHIKSIKQSQYDRLLMYYQKLQELKATHREDTNGTNINN